MAKRFVTSVGVPLAFGQSEGHGEATMRRIVRDTFSPLEAFPG